jgi:hypothetical protein
MFADRWAEKTGSKHRALEAVPTGGKKRRRAMVANNNVRPNQSE